MGLGDSGVPGTFGDAFGTSLCLCSSASCLLWAGSSALLMGRGGSCASGAAGRKVTPLGVGTGCLGSPVEPKSDPVVGSGTLDEGAEESKSHKDCSAGISNAHG